MRVGLAADQAVTHHPVDGARDRRRLDGHHPAELALGLAVLGVQDSRMAHWARATSLRWSRCENIWAMSRAARLTR